MPKEGFHIYLADKYLKSGGNTIPAAVRLERQAFLIGALSPDIFFYELPSFSLTPFGGSLHNLMERKGIAPIHDWIRETSASPARKLAWALGFASHCLADGIWHPTINALSRSHEFCGDERITSGFTEENCHHLLECELEAFWLERAGVSRGYVSALNLFRKDRRWLFEIASYYREFLDHAGLQAVPPEKKIVKCYLEQNFLLRLFANTILGKLRDRMVSFRPTRYIGGLVVPDRPVLPAVFSRKYPEDRNPFSDHFMERGLTSFAAQLSELSGQLSPFMPLRA